MADVETAHRPAWAEVDLAAVRANVAAIAELVAPAAMCVVVKANGYGHGAVPVAEAALNAGASWLAVALVEEGVALRREGIDAPILLLSEPPLSAMPAARRHRLTPTLYTNRGVKAAAEAATNGPGPWAVHVKVDTGMHRVGAHPGDAAVIVASARASRRLDVEGLWTHLAVADEPDRADDFTAHQLDAFAAVVDDLARRGPRPPLLHAANSAGALLHPAARLDLVRCGIAAYGIPPAPGRDGGVPLQPAMTLRAEVTFAKRLPAGEGLSYGLHYVTSEPTVIATVPLGYADGVPRRLAFTGGEVLIGGQRRPIAGAVTMDQLLVDCGRDADVSVGDEVVLIGSQGDDRITADEWAGRLDTIAYEIVCGIGARVPRIYRP